MRRILVLMLTLTLVSGCANEGLQTLSSTSRGPDEFIVEPKAELETPDTFAQLPPPTPGQGNRADIDHSGQMITALGGRPQNASGPIPASDGALVTASSRFGVTPEIRKALAEEDAAFRSRQGRFSQLQIFPENLYNRVYREQALDARATADAWRRSGARTPSYPPTTE